MNYDQIYDEYDFKYRSMNNAIFEQFIEEFRKRSGVDARKVLDFLQVWSDDPKEVFHLLLNFIMDYKPQYIELFYQLLAEFNYNMALDLADFMGVIGRHGISDILPFDMQSFLLKSPLIHGITNNQGIITFSTNQFGNISFCSTKKYFQDDSSVSQFLQMNPVSRKCHFISWQLLSFLKNASLITALIPNYFVGTYYHTIIRNQDGMLIDSATSLVYDESTFANLFRGEIVSETNQDDVLESYHKAIDDGVPTDFAPALVLALHKQKQNLGRN